MSAYNYAMILSEKYVKEKLILSKPNMFVYLLIKMWYFSSNESHTSNSLPLFKLNTIYYYYISLEFIW